MIDVLPESRIVYLDTSVFGAVVDDELPDRIGGTVELFALIRMGRIVAATSVVTIEEIEAAPASVVSRIALNRDAVEERIWQVSDEPSP